MQKVLIFVNLVYQTEDSDFNTEESNARPVMAQPGLLYRFLWDRENFVHVYIKCTNAQMWPLRLRRSPINHYIGEMKLVWQFV